MQDVPQGSSETIPSNPSRGIAERSLSLAHLELCLKLGRPLVVAVTKMDLATRTGLRQVLSQVLSVVKATGRTPVLVNTPAAQNFRREDVDFSTKVDDLVIDEQTQIDEKLAVVDASNPSSCVPIVMTSALSGSGIASLHAILRALPPLPTGVVHHVLAPTDEQVVFRTDEVFAIPPSRVYSTSTERSLVDSGVVLCGPVASGTISLGDELLLGPFLVETETDGTKQASGIRRTLSHHSKSLGHSSPRNLSGMFSSSLQLEGHRASDNELTAQVEYVAVRVVSLRNLRLSVSSMHAGDTGTVGIQPINTNLSPEMSLDKARKGMILARPSSKRLQGHSTFTATFPYSDFGNTSSPPLILGGHAIVYIHTIRAPVKVTAVALEDHNESTGQNVASCVSQTVTHDEVFSFEEEDDDDDNDAKHADDEKAPARSQERGNLKISFRFVRTVEYLDKNDQVLVVPNVMPAGPVTGPVSTSIIPGFSGFVGRICEMYT